MGIDPYGLRTPVHARRSRVSSARDVARAAALIAILVLAPFANVRAVPARREAAALLGSLRYALATNDAAAVRALLAPDAELVELSADSPSAHTYGADPVATALLARTGVDAEPGPAIRVRDGYTVGSLVVVAESLPRVVGEPTRLAMYRLASAKQIARIWLFPNVARDTPSSLAQVIRYREIWSAGQWAEVAKLHAPDIGFLEIAGGTVSSAGSVDARRHCYQQGFALWRTRKAPGAHPSYGCSGGPIEVVQGVAVGPYVVTVEKRWWAVRESDYTGRMFLYVAGSSGIRRVYYVLTL